MSTTMNTSKMIFVFGSNLKGIHGAGAARFAQQNKGAVIGKGEGHWGQSYAIPTKDYFIHTLRLSVIESHVKMFMRYAGDPDYPGLQYQVTAIGCGLAGLSNELMAPMFINAPANCYFDHAWKPWLGDNHKYWGTF